MRMKRPGKGKACVLALALVSICAGLAWAGPRDHEDGILLRLSGGVGHLDTDAGNQDLSGVTGDINFALGGIVSPNFALHATLLEWSVTDPDLEIGDVKSQLSGHMSMTGVAAGMTYYFMPKNVYLSPSVGIGRLDLIDRHTDLGLVTDITLAKEWWTGGNWGLGIAGAAGYRSFHDDEVGRSWSGATFTLRFTSTLN